MSDEEKTYDLIDILQQIILNTGADETIRVRRWVMKDIIFALQMGKRTEADLRVANRAYVRINTQLIDSQKEIEVLKYELKKFAEQDEK